MTTTTALVTGLGGSIGIDVARSLGLAPDVRVIGCDASGDALRMTSGLADDTALVPRADLEPNGYIDAIEGLIRDHGIDYVFVNPDPELAALAEKGTGLSCDASYPRGSALAVCMDKARTAEHLADAAAATVDGELCPRTVSIGGGEDVARAFDLLGAPLWLRARSGPGGRGSLIVERPAEAKAWIDYWRRRDRADEWMLQEYLPGVNANWTAVYREGVRVAEAAMHRLGYFLSDVAPTGVTGQVSACETVDPRGYRERCDSAVRALVDVPHGIFSVDLREDRRGIPRITEVNPRFAGRPWLYTRAGLNLPLVAVRKSPASDRSPVVRPGVRMYRQLDMEPLLVEPESSASEDAIRPPGDGDRSRKSTGGERSLDEVALQHDQTEGFTPRLIQARASMIRRVVAGVVLDLGCADGLLTRAIAESVSRVVAVDASGVRIERTRRRCEGLPVDLRRARVEDFRPEPGERFDAVVISCLLEHVENPVGLLRRSREWLGEGGTVVAIVPHGRSLHRRIGVRMGLLEDLTDMGPSDDDLDHQRVYDMPGLVRDFREAGLEVLESGGILLKPLPNDGMADLSPALVDALEALGPEFPELAAELYVVGAPRGGHGRSRSAGP